MEGTLNSSTVLEFAQQVAKIAYQQGYQEGSENEFQYEFPNFKHFRRV